MRGQDEGNWFPRWAVRSCEICWAFDLEKGILGLVEFAHRPYKSGATRMAHATNTHRPPVQATHGVAGYMRREETKHKKPLASRHSCHGHSVQPNPILLRPAASASLRCGLKAASLGPSGFGTALHCAVQPAPA